MIIDGHAHSCGQFFKPEQIIARLDELKVDKVVLCPGVKNGPAALNFIPGLARFFSRSDILLSVNKIINLLSKVQRPDDLLARNEYVYSIYKKYPERIIQFFWANPNVSQIDLYQKFASWSFKGIKLHQCAHNFPIPSPGLATILDFAREKEIPVFIHLRSRNDIHKFVIIAKQYPVVNFIIAHLLGLEIFIKYKTELKNLYFDISPTPLTSLKRINLAINNFGVDKIILGSDTPFGKDNLQRNIQKVRQLKISNGAKELILGGNLQKLLKL